MPLSPEDYERLLKKVKGFWLRWAHKHRRSEAMYDEPWHDLVIRAGLVLKLLTNPETGAIAAAPTTSLPENIGGVRNWDYRFAWIRDASFTVQAFFHLGHVQESEDFRRWMREIIRQTKEPSQIRVLYGLHGETDLEEQVVDSLFGYKNSSPVRIGNDAAKQNQLDIYGELLNAIYDTTRYGENISQDLWSTIRKIVDYVCQVWDTKDAGIWEIRGEPRHFVYSKLMCWVAIDRGTKIARLKGFEAPVDRWKRIGEEIRQAIVEKGFSHIGLINGALYLGIAKGRTHQGPKPLGVV